MADDLDDETKKTKRVGRLSDMDTREVSVVDRAANKRTFLMVKRDDKGATEMGDTKTTEEPQVQKRVVPARLEEALERVDTVKAAVEACAVDEKAASIPSVFVRELRATQYLLKGIAGTTPFTMLVPSGGEVPADVAMSATAKAETMKVLDECGRRLTTLKGELADAEVLDATQVRSVDAVADLIGKACAGKTGTLVVLKGSLDDADRAVALGVIEKALAELSDVYVALQTDVAGLAKASIADEFEVGSRLHATAAAVEKAVAEILADAQERAPFQAGVEALRSIEKGLTGATEGRVQEVTKALGATLTQLAKAATMYRASYGPGERYRCVLTTADEVVGEFDTYMEAEQEALKRNMQALLAGSPDMQKNLETLMKNLGGTTTAPAASETPAATSETPASAPADKAQETDGQTETDKVGRPMQSDRLRRLQGVVKLLKEALGDLRAGSVSMDKFNQVGNALTSLLAELTVSTDKANPTPEARGTVASNPNAGAGATPDTSVDQGLAGLSGEGAPDMAALLKREVTKAVESALKPLQAEVAKRDKQLEELRTENASLRKARTAPAAPPSDEPVAKRTPAQQNDDDFWPMDMNDWSPKKRSSR